MPPRLENVAHTLAVASGKGGVGKTTVTVHLALALAQRGARVGLFDADVYGPNVPLMLGIHRRQPARGTIPVARAGGTPYITPLERFGLKLMSIGLLVGESDTVQPDPRFVARIALQTLRDVRWGPLDYLLIDLPPGTGEPQQSLVRELILDGAILVTTPQDLSLLDTGRSLGLFRQANVPLLGVVENMSYLNCPHCGEPIEFFQRGERDWGVGDAELPLLGRVPMEQALSRRITADHPLLLAEPTVEANVFSEIAAKVARRLAG